MVIIAFCVFRSSSVSTGIYSGKRLRMQAAGGDQLGSPLGVVIRGESPRGGEFQFVLDEGPCGVSLLLGFFSRVLGSPGRGAKKVWLTMWAWGARWAPLKGIVTNSWPKTPRNGVPNGVLVGDISGMHQKS